MSASTLSITATPAATRRRPAVVRDKKPAIELVGTASADGGGGGGGGGEDKEMSHSIERSSREHQVVQVKKTVPSSAAAAAATALPPRRTSRKKAEKPRWLTVISVFTKNFFLLLALAGLIQMIRRLAVSNTTTSPITDSSTTTGVSEFERRIVEVENFLKTTTKMMQVQVEAVDRKIGNEIGGLRTELNQKIEDEGTEFETELKKLDGRTASLEKSLVELSSSTKWLSKEDLEKFFEEFKKAKGVDQDGYGDGSFDEIRAFAREIVEKEMEKHVADGLGRVDYALASAGAMVIKHSEPYAMRKGSSWFYGTDRNEVHRDANMMLTPSFGEPGHCFPLKGSSGFVHIKLRTAIIPEAITLEHVAKSVAYDRSSAPKDCRISGWLQGHHDTTTNRAAADAEEKMFLLTEFSYDLEKSNAQTFDLSDSGNIVNMIRLDFTSNHGSPSHTCIYRLRVHGHEPDSTLPLLATQS